MLLLGRCKRDCVESLKIRVQSEPLVQSENFGIASENEVLTGINPLFLYWFKEGGNPTAEDTGSLKESNLIPSRAGSFCGGNPRQPPADNA